MIQACVRRRRIAANKPACCCASANAYSDSFAKLGSPRHLNVALLEYNRHGPSPLTNRRCKMSGARTLFGELRIFDVTPGGFWLGLGDEKFCVAYADFPWFAGATLAQIENVQRPS